MAAAGRFRPRQAHLLVGCLTITVLAVLSVVGNAIKPRWEPPARSQVDLDARPSARPSVHTANADREIRRERVEVTGNDVTLAGRVVSPAEPGRYPAVVLVHGAGEGPWTSLVGTAEALARKGVVALVYDKRADYTYVSHDFAVLAEDALGGVRALRERGDVDQDRVGLWGFSEGGWVLPLAANRQPELVDFLILVSPPNVAPLHQAAWTLHSQLDRIGASPGVQELMARRVGAGGFVSYATHDPGPSLARVRQPVLALYGENDTTAPPATSASVLRQALERNGNEAYAIHVFPGTGHELRRTDGSHPPDYVPTMTSWLHGFPGTTTPRRHLVGPVPAQRYAVPSLPGTPWYAADRFRYGPLALAACCYLVGPVLALASRLRGRRLWTEHGAPWWRRRARRLAAAGVGTFALGFVTSGVVLALSSRGWSGARWPQAPGSPPACSPCSPWP